MARLCPPNKYERALELFDKDPEAGLERLEALARKYAKDAGLRHALGISYLRMDRPKEALPHLEWAARRHEDPEVYRGLILAYMRLEMPTYAARAARRAREEGLADIPAPEEISPETVPDGMTEKDRLEFERARMEIFHAEAAGVGRMEALARRFPDFQATHNLVATGYFVLGEMARYRQTADAALARAPSNIHALLNSVRLELLEHGLEEARELLPRVREAPTSREVGIVAGELAQAQALAYLGEAEGARQALEAFLAGGGAEPAAEQLEGYLELHETDSRAPLLRLRDLLAGYFRRWRMSGEKLLEVAGVDLATLPGVLTLLPEVISYEDEPIARILATVLLSEHAPPAPTEPWAEVLERIVQEGPGTREARLALLKQLADLGRLEPDTVIPFKGSEQGLKYMQLELVTEPMPNSLSEEDQKTHEAAYELMQDGDFAGARPLLASLQETYPQVASVAFNLAMSEVSAGGDSARHGRARLERLVRELPRLPLCQGAPGR